MTDTTAKKLPANTITLETPLKRGDTEITTVTFRKPSSGELRGLSLTAVLEMEVDSLIKLLPRITTPSLAEHEVSQLDVADLVQAGNQVATFLVPKAQQAYLEA